MNKSVLVIDTPKSCWMCPIATDHSVPEVSVYCPVIALAGIIFPKKKRWQ